MNEIDREWLLDMLEYAQTAIRILGKANAATLAADQTSFLAVSYAVQVIGEAANKVSPAGQAALPDVPWRDAIAMRHRLVHGYRSRSAEIMVQTIAVRLPELTAVLERILNKSVDDERSGALPSEDQ
ncbi:MAG: DUF86 domain-containing protein [Pseudomonadota bacterium]|nr:DUF86 domain-containing protein [Pseudomonadota bacterium]